MRNPNDPDDPNDIVDLVQNSVWAHSRRVGAFELMTQRLSDAMRIVGQWSRNERYDGIERLGRQPIKGTTRRRTQLDAVAQAGGA